MERMAKIVVIMGFIFIIISVIGCEGEEKSADVNQTVADLAGTSDSVISSEGEEKSADVDQTIADPAVTSDNTIFTSARNVSLDEINDFFLETETDTNWISFEAEFGETYMIETGAISDNSESDADTVISLFNENMTLLSKNDDMAPSSSTGEITQYVEGKIRTLVSDFLSGKQNDIIDVIQGKKNSLYGLLQEKDGYPVSC